MMNLMSKHILTLTLCSFVLGSFVTIPECAVANPDGQTQAAKAKKAKTSPKKTSTKNKEASQKEFTENFEKLAFAYGEKRYVAALSYCEKAMNLIPDDMETDEIFKLKNACSSLYRMNHRYEDSLKLLKEIQKLPLNARQKEMTCFDEAVVLTDMLRYDEAIRKYEECPGTQTGEKSAIAGNVAELLMDIGNPKAAVEKYQQALEADPRNPYALFGIAVAFTRTRDEKSAEKYFLKGIEADPNFSYFKQSEFHPDYELDYQLAVHFMLMHREKEAKFYLEKYLKNETRMNYRAIASEQLEKINWNIQNHQTALIGTYPVLLDRVVAIAIDNSGKKLAFADVPAGMLSFSGTILSAIDADPEMISKVWTVDLETGKTTRRIQQSNLTVLDMAFIENSSKLRILGNEQHYELDVDQPEGGYLCYDNHPDVTPLLLSGTGEDIISFDGTQITLAPWKNPWASMHVVNMPMNIIKFAISQDYQNLFSLSLYGDISIQNLEESKDLSPSHQFPNPTPISSIDSHPSENIFAYTLESGTILMTVNGEFAFVGAQNWNDTAMTVTRGKLLSFSPNGRYLAIYSNKSVEIWDMDKLKPHIQKP